MGMLGTILVILLYIAIFYTIGLAITYVAVIPLLQRFHYHIKDGKIGYIFDRKVSFEDFIEDKRMDYEMVLAIWPMFVPVSMIALTSMYLFKHAKRVISATYNINFREYIENARSYFLPKDSEK